MNIYVLQNIKYSDIPQYAGTGDMVATHGYDNADTAMRAIFLASGPGHYSTCLLTHTCIIPL